MPEELYAGAEGGAVALGQTGGGVAEGGQTVQALQDRGAGDRLAPGDLENQEDQGRLDPSCLHDANIWNNLSFSVTTAAMVVKVLGKYQKFHESSRISPFHVVIFFRLSQEFKEFSSRSLKVTLV